MQPLYKKYEDLQQSTSQQQKNAFDNDVMTLQNLNHKKKVIKENYLVVVDIFGTHCNPCKESMPLFAELAKKYNNPGHCYLVKEDFQMGMSPEITTVPTFLFYVNGVMTPVHSISGTNMFEIERVINIILQRKNA